MSYPKHEEVLDSAANSIINKVADDCIYLKGSLVGIYFNIKDNIIGGEIDYEKDIRPLILKGLCGGRGEEAYYKMFFEMVVCRYLNEMGKEE